MGTISRKNVRKAFGEAVIIPGADLEIEHGHDAPIGLMELARVPTDD